MSFLSLIEAKRDGHELAPDALRAMVKEFVHGSVPDYQMAALLMAIYFRGLSPAETRELTLAMRDSGEVLTFPRDSRPVVDKHSTGGIGDKVSLPLAPLLACLGFRVPMISGRGLGITGGTLDKLESIPGFSTQLEPARIVEQVQTLGVAMAGQTTRMVPADRLLYALRDVTATVPSIALITASILSKKLAENLDALVLDVKFGAAAFMTTVEQARALAESLVHLARECGVKTRAVLSDMNTPVGHSAGNWLEVKEAVACLEGHGPSDLEALVIQCAALLLTETGRAPDSAAAQFQARQCLRSGEPLRKWQALLEAQGADLNLYQQRLHQDSLAPVVREVLAEHAGFVHTCDSRIIGEVVRDLGGGRLHKTAVIQPEVGVDQIAKPGTKLNSGAVVCRIHAMSVDTATLAADRLSRAFRIADEPPTLEPLIREAEFPPERSGEPGRTP